MDETPDTATVLEAVKCSECQSSLVEGQDRMTTEEGVTFCRPCFDNLTVQLRQVVEAQGTDINYPLAAVGGLAGGAAGVLVWWGFTVMTNIAFGLVAIVIGIAVGKGIVMLSDGKRSVNLQVLSVAISILSFAYASYLVNRSFILKAYAEEGLTLPWLPDPALMFNVLQAGFSFMDIVFVAIVIYQAWKIPAPIRLAG